MAHKEVTLFDRVFKDREGKVTIWQNPNVPLWCWVVFSVLGIVFKHGAGHTGLQRLAEASLFTWAYLEIRTGVNVFRQILGAAIMIGVVYGFFTS